MVVLAELQQADSLHWGLVCHSSRLHNLDLELSCCGFDLAEAFAHVYFFEDLCAVVGYHRARAI